MKSTLQRAAALIAAHVPDALLVGGAVSFSYGAWMAWPPLGPLVGGAFALAGGWLMARSNG